MPQEPRSAGKLTALATRSLNAGIAQVMRWDAQRGASSAACYTDPAGEHLADCALAGGPRTHGTPQWKVLETGCAYCSNAIVVGASKRRFGLPNDFVKMVEKTYTASRLDVEQLRATRPDLLADHLSKLQAVRRGISGQLTHLATTYGSFPGDELDPVREAVRNLETQISRLEGEPDDLLAQAAAAWREVGVTELDQTPVLVLAASIGYKPSALTVSLTEAFAVAHGAYWLPRFAAEAIVAAAYQAGTQFTKVQITPCPDRQTAAFAAALVTGGQRDAAAAVGAARDALLAPVS